MKTSHAFVFLILICNTYPRALGTDVYYPKEDWRISTPQEQGLSSEKLRQMMTFIEENYLQIEGIVLIRNGYLVFEQYPSQEYDAETRHYLYSVTKSFTSALIGIALNQSLITNTSKTMISFFPDREIANSNGSKNKVTVEDLLMMRSGMKWDETSAGYDTPENDIYHINHGDGLQYCLDLPMIAEPGEQWYYNTGSSHILSGIIRQTSGTSTLDFAKTYLFGPIGVENVIWSADLGGTQKGGFDLQLTPRDMARFGYLYLNKGRWEDTQVIPEEWVELSTSTQTQLNNELGYGYQWWTLPHLNAYRASGLYGQQIFVAPDEEIIFVLTGHISPTQHELEESIFETYVLGAVQVDEGSNRVPGFSLTQIISGLTVFLTFLYYRYRITIKTRP
jgi:CubicO group peptidase (beta-lactamase class C family)